MSPCYTPKDYINPRVISVALLVQHVVLERWCSGTL